MKLCAAELLFHACSEYAPPKSRSRISEDREPCRVPRAPELDASMVGERARNGVPLLPCAAMLMIRHPLVVVLHCFCCCWVPSILSGVLHPLTSSRAQLGCVSDPRLSPASALQLSPEVQTLNARGYLKICSSELFTKPFCSHSDSDSGPGTGTGARTWSFCFVSDTLPNLQAG